MLDKCHILLLCDNSYIYANTVSMQYQNKTDENKISTMHFIPEIKLWRTKG